MSQLGMHYVFHFVEDFDRLWKFVFHRNFAVEFSIVMYLPLKMNYRQLYRKMSLRDISATIETIQLSVGPCRRDAQSEEKNPKVRWKQLKSLLRIKHRVSTGVTAVLFLRRPRYTSSIHDRSNDLIRAQRRGILYGTLRGGCRGA